jgi:hypothetical protein
MLRTLVRVSLVLTLIAVPAAADVFHVRLANGTVIDSSVQPQQASWDPNMIMLMTDVGNWVGFMKDEIASIDVEDPTSGFGVRISNTAIALGRFSNDLPTDQPGSPQDAFNQRYLDLANRIVESQERQQRYTVEQFVEPEESQGIPAAFGGGYGTGYGGGGGGFGSIPLEPNTDRFVEPQDRITFGDGGNGGDGNNQ